MTFSFFNSINFILLSSIILFVSSGNIIYKGVTFVGDRYCPEVSFDDPLAFESLANLAKTGANYIALVVTEYQDFANSTKIAPIYENYPKSAYYTYKTESIPAIKAIINEAHRLKLKVMMKPHIDLSKEPNYSSKWRGDIGEFKTEEQWTEWFNSYEEMIVKYAKLSEELKVEMLSVSCELIRVNHREKNWRKIIEEIRKVYHGLLTDSANHSGEEISKAWWDAVDVIGVDAYYLPIRSRSLGAIQKDVDQRLAKITVTLENLSKKWGNKDIIITEIGFCSGNCIIGNRSFVPTLEDHYIQAYFYERFMAVLSEKPFIKGFFWWSWNTDPNTGGVNDHCITPQLKQAEYVMYKYYGGNLKDLSFTPKNPPKCLCTI